ncbi:MAG TPA: hypothetical protein GX015_02720 [Corynebacterium sp.]|nr:hypothetical protein [Corynebacterium sp.]HHT31448.1 hypothetical protein [Corynebacterium sp.]
MIYMVPGIAAAFFVWIVLGIGTYAYNRSTGQRTRLKRDAFLTIGLVAWAAYTGYFVVFAFESLLPAYSAMSLGYFIVWGTAGLACYRRNGGYPGWMKYPGLKSGEGWPSSSET